MKTKPIIVSTALTLALYALGSGQIPDAPGGTNAGIPVNYTEAEVGTYTLPDPLKLSDGRPVTDAKTWFEQRRPEILRLFETEVYGRVPATAPKVFWKVVSVDSNALNGLAIKKDLAGHMGDPDGPAIKATLYTPAQATKPVPVFVNLTFDFSMFARRQQRSPGATNEAVTGTNLATPGPAMRTNPAASQTNRAESPTREFVLRGTPEEFITNGFAYASVIYNTIETDQQGRPNLNLARKLALKPDQTEPAPDEWGCIAAWAWGLSRFIDYLGTEPAVDSSRIAIFGVSRLGKTVLWAGAADPRVALVISSCSGEGGAALARRNYGETIAHLVAPSRYSYQFAKNYAKYASDPNKLPVDSHMLLALIAPRPVLIQSGDADRWADPKGEFLATVAARPVYELLGRKGPDTDQLPPPGKLVGETLAFYMHAGGHGPLPSDWDVFLEFLRRHLVK